MRYLVAAIVATIAGLMLLGVLRNPLLKSHAEGLPTDEILAYVISTNQSVTIGLLQRTDEVRLTSWCVVERALPEERFDYSIEIDWQAGDSLVLGSNRLAFESRVSQPESTLPPASYAARLAYSKELVTDSRTLRVLVPEFSGTRPTQMRIKRGENDTRRVLVRATFPDTRQSLEVAAVDRRLTPLERTELVRDRSSVTYDELPQALRFAAIATWQRRLDAFGIEDRDYRVERLLVGTGRAGAGLFTAQQRTFSVHRQHGLALNLRRRVQLTLYGAPHASLVVSSVTGENARAIPLSENGIARVEAGGSEFAESIAVTSGSEVPIPLRIRVAASDAGAVVGPIGLVQSTDEVEVAPMLRRSSYYQLDSEDGVALSPATGQALLGVTLRGLAAAPSGRIEAEIDGQRAALDIALRPSTFEEWSDGTPATEEQRLYLRLPPGTKRVLLRGTSSLRVAPFTNDPDVTIDRLAAEYDVALSPESRWKHARYDIDRSVALRPDNDAELTSASRRFELLAQSRIVPLERSNGQPEAALAPTSTAVIRHVIEPIRWGPGIGVPEDVVIAMNAPRRGYVPAQGPRAGRVRVSYRLGPNDVGEPLDVLVDGTSIHREETVANFGQFDVSVTSGNHGFEVRGPREAAQILLEASPLEAGGALRRRVTYRIMPGSVLRFVITKQVPTLNVVVTTYQPNQRRVSLNYALVAHQTADLLHAITPLRGEISGIALPAPGVWFWESGPEQPLNRHRAVITIGDDIRAEPFALVVRNTNPTPIYVALVVVGQLVGSRPTLQRFWTTEDP